jgi:hypothetical protein
MRIAPALLALALAGPAMAQPYTYLGVQARDAQTQADLQALRYRDVQITNELAAAQARAQADQALSNLQAARATPALPGVLGPAANSGAGSPAVIDTRKLVSIPDDVLARSNARVRAAADNRR